MAAIFNNSRWLPLMRFNMTANAPHHLYKNLKFSECSKFSDVRNSPPPHTLIMVYGSHTGINMCAHCSLHLPKIVSKKPSVNHIGSSMSHQSSKVDFSVVFTISYCKNTMNFAKIFFNLLFSNRNR